ncbi:hypothetical protein U9M48_025429 [Paspalum notatum var. saurae]|uniref:Cytochrome P450 n=1 Tax=Paspalum notatum var. saurae TaxID=547442 RepID=A0AAQ3WXI8_PASNO
MSMAADLPLYLYLLLLAVPLILFATPRRPAPRGRLPPRPWALPVIGHLHHLAGALPHRALRDLARRHRPLMLLRLGELPVAVASSPDAAREVLRTHDAAFASRPMSPMQELAYRGARGVIFAPYGEGPSDDVGRLLRAVAAAAAAAEPAPVNLSEGVAAFVADSTVRAIIGSRFRHRDAYLRMLQEGLKIVPGMTLPDLFPSSRLARLVSSVPGKIERHRRGMLQFIDAIIEEHRESRAAGKDDDEEDLLGVLLRLQKEVDARDPLTTDNIKTVMLDMFGAGSETSATTLQWAMAELMRNPRVTRKAQDKLRRELGDHGKVTEDRLTGLHYLPLVVKETLRLHLPAPLLLPRRCGSPCRVLGFDVPEGTMVPVNAWAISRDPEHWDDPDEFVPERFERGERDFRGNDFEFIPFGAGRRMCPGMAFGLAHIELALAALLFHFDWEF